MHENYARNKPRAVSSNENHVRVNGGKPIALLLVPGLIPDVQSWWVTGDINRCFGQYVLQDSYVSCQRLFIHFSGYTSSTLHLWAYQESPHRKVALKTSPQHHLIEQQRHLGQSEARPSSKLIFETSRWILFALKGHISNSWLSHLQSPINS